MDLYLLDYWISLSCCLVTYVIFRSVCSWWSHFSSNSISTFLFSQLKRYPNPYIWWLCGKATYRFVAVKSTKFPAMRFGGRIFYSKTASEVDMRATQLLRDLETKRDESGSAIVGFDVEWRPNFTKGFVLSIILFLFFFFFWFVCLQV